MKKFCSFCSKKAICEMSSSEYKYPNFFITHTYKDNCNLKPILVKVTSHLRCCPSGKHSYARECTQLFTQHQPTKYIVSGFLIGCLDKVGVARNKRDELLKWTPQEKYFKYQNFVCMSVLYFAFFRSNIYRYNDIILIPFRQEIQQAVAIFLEDVQSTVLIQFTKIN